MIGNSGAGILPAPPRGQSGWALHQEGRNPARPERRGNIYTRLGVRPFINLTAAYNLRGLLTLPAVKAAMDEASRYSVNLDELMDDDCGWLVRKMNREIGRSFFKLKYSQAVELILSLTGRNQRPAEDPHHAAAVERGRAAVKELQERGIIDALGHRISIDLPADMLEGGDRDCGG